MEPQAFGFLVKLFVNADQDTPVSIDFPRCDFAFFMVGIYHFRTPFRFQDCTALVSLLSSPIKLGLLKSILSVEYQHSCQVIHPNNLL